MIPLFAVVVLSAISFPSPIPAQIQASSCSIEISRPALHSAYSSPVVSATVGQEFVLTVTATNCSGQQMPFTALIEVRSSIGVTQYIGWQSGVLQGADRAEIGVSWTPSFGDNFEVRSFVVSDLQTPLMLSGVSTSQIQIAEENTENLVLEFNTTKTNVSTTEVFGTSYHLVNKGHDTLPIAIHDYIGAYESLNGATAQRMGPDVSCLWKWSTEIVSPDTVLAPGQSMNLTEKSSQSSAPKIPGIYYFTPFVVLSVQTHERVKCIEIAANTIALNVTAPAYDGVQLVAQSDKRSYKHGENVTISLYIENNGDKPFRTTEIEPTVRIIEESIGLEVYNSGFVADYYEYPIVQPHSRFDLSPQLVWNQKTFQQDGSLMPATPGRYTISATFTYPYLESQEYTITIEEPE